MNIMYIRTLRTNKMGYNILGNNHGVTKYQIITFTVYIHTQSTITKYTITVSNKQNDKKYKRKTIKMQLCKLKKKHLA